MARAKCNDEPTMILSEQDYIDYGNSFGLKTNEVVNEIDVAFLDCDHKNDKPVAKPIEKNDSVRK